MTRAQRREAVTALVDAAMRMTVAARALDACDGCPECAEHAAEMRVAADVADSWIVAIEGMRVQS